MTVKEPRARVVGDKANHGEAAGLKGYTTVGIWKALNLRFPDEQDCVPNIIPPSSRAGITGARVILSLPSADVPKVVAMKVPRVRFTDPVASWIILKDNVVDFPFNEFVLSNFFKLLHTSGLEAIVKLVE